MKIDKHERLKGIREDKMVAEKEDVMVMKEYSYGFSENDFEKFRNRNKNIQNHKLRGDNETLADFIKSDKADFSKLPEGEDILEYLISIGEQDE